MRDFRSELGMVVLALTLGGCSADFEARHDHVTVIFNGERTTVAMEGSVSVEIGGVPELSYSGPAGCPGRYFVDDESDIYFRWDAKRAYLLRGNQLYTFDESPRDAGSDIAWSHTFSGDKITVLANCPLP